MYEIIFYADNDGYSELYEELQNLAEQSLTNKDCRIQLKQITLYIELLKNQGTIFQATSQSTSYMMFGN